MSSPKFSIITPVNVWNDYRAKSLVRLANSLRNQTYQNFEWIIVDDGSTKEFDWSQFDDINHIIVHKIHGERIIAYSEGLKEATGDWICLVDSDDEYVPEYLETFLDKIRIIKRYKMFNCGAKFIHADGGENLRDAFKPKRKKEGHEEFSGGNIVNGTFVFHKSVYRLLGGYPPAVIKDANCSGLNYGTSYGAPVIRDLYMGTPFDFSAAAQLEFPEIRKYFMVNVDSEPDKVIKELGNPWGNDYYLFYKYTRKYHSLAFDEPLLTVYLKKGVE